MVGQDKRIWYNSRIYIVSAAVLLSALILALVRLQFGSDQLFYIRLEQVYGFTAVGFWYLTLLVSPLGAAIGMNHLKVLEFSRRGFGISTFYFAWLHVIVAVWGQLGGLGKLGLLPPIYGWSILGGLIALIILTIMAATSFDKIIDKFTFRRWKWIHRFVYLAGVLAVVHVWTIGTHFGYMMVQLVAIAMLAILLGLEIFRVLILVNRRFWHLEGWEVWQITFIVWLALTVALLLFMPRSLPNFHSQHVGHGAHSHQGAE